MAGRQKDGTGGESNLNGIVLIVVLLVVIGMGALQGDMLGNPTVRTMLVGLGIMLIYVVVAANCRKRAASAPLVHRDVAFEPDPVFTRAEMKSEALAGSVKLYDRHMFVVGGNASTWPSHVDTPVVVQLSEAKARSSCPLRITACFPFHVGPAVSKLACENSVLIFPDRIAFREASPACAGLIVDSYINKGQLVSQAKPTPINWDGYFIFVCCHRARDVRCGACGPQLLKQFKACIVGTKLENKVHLFGCSHVGGHKYAGNVIAFGRKRECGQTIGDWYGYVTPDRCADIIDSLVTNGAPVCDLWRGQMGVDPDEHKRLVTENGEGSQKPAEPRQPAVAQGLRRRVGAAEQAADGMQGCGEGCACVGKQGQE